MTLRLDMQSCFVICDICGELDYSLPSSYMSPSLANSYTALRG